LGPNGPESKRVRGGLQDLYRIADKALVTGA
jgi:hypothetical protein